MRQILLATFGVVAFTAAARAESNRYFYDVVNLDYHTRAAVGPWPNELTCAERRIGFLKDVTSAALGVSPQLAIHLVQHMTLSECYSR